MSKDLDRAMIFLGHDGPRAVELAAEFKAAKDEMKADFLDAFKIATQMAEAQKDEQSTVLMNLLAHVMGVVCQHIT